MEIQLINADQTKTQQLNGIEASRQQRTGSFTPFSGVPVYNLINVASMHGDLVSNQVRNPAAPTPKPEGPLPAYIKPLPQRMAADDITHLWKKGALAIPETAFRDELLRSYIEFVHPYMPLIELHDFLRIVDKGTGEDGRISLLLFQAVMFTGIAFVDMSWLTAAGFATRKAARKAFYLKARVRFSMFLSLVSFLTFLGSLRLRLRVRSRGYCSISSSHDLLV
jgi:hypothetical protein